MIFAERKKMQITVADHAGFCFGVRNIDEIATNALKEYPHYKVYSDGPLVHNDQYVAKRREDGIEVLLPSDIDQLDENCVVIIRAHGIPVSERKKLEETKAVLLDGTCPVLQGIYHLGRKRNEKGERIVIIGHAEHPEIRAMRSHFADDTVVIENAEEAEAFRSEKPVFIISQTTNRPEYFTDLAQRIAKNNRAEIHSTICRATKDRQAAAAALAKKSDAMIILGGNSSSNTEKLRQVCKKYCRNVQKVEVFSQIALQNMSNFIRIGISAGASTPDWIIEEVVKGMDNFSKEEFMEQVEDSMTKIYPRDIITGTVIAVKEDEVYVDIKYRSDGIIKKDEMSDEQAQNPMEHFHEGEEVGVYVIKLDDGEGNVVLSTRRVEGLKNWQKLVEEYEADAIVKALVTNDNRGGLVVNVMGVNGFIPASQITTYFVKNFKQFIGQTLDCKILSVDERKMRVVLSSRAVQEAQLDEVWEKIVVGEQVHGKVVRMTDFGAFVDLGGVDGLIHVSDISWSRIERPSDVLSIGQEIDPIVLKANRERNRISLGLKQLTQKPFVAFSENHKAGDMVKGTIVNMLDFGAFVRLEEGVEGLIHVSQIAPHHVEKPSDELSVGQEIEARILEIDTDRQRIALSLRPANEPEKRDEEKRTYDQSRFEKKPAQEPKQPKQRREKKKVQPQLDFEGNFDIGTNLGDLIAAQLNLEAATLPEGEETSEE